MKRLIVVCMQSTHLCQLCVHNPCMHNIILYPFPFHSVLWNQLVFLCGQIQVGNPNESDVFVPADQPIIYMGECRNAMHT